MQRPGTRQEVVDALLQAQEDIDRKRHKRDPFAAKYVDLATSEFGRAAAAQADQPPDADRTTVEAAATNVHVRVELIKTMKNALVKQTQEAVKRAAPPQRPRLGTRGGNRQQAAAATAAAVGGGTDQSPIEDDAAGSNPASFYRGDLHQQFQLLIQGALLPAPGLEKLQEQLLRGQGDATRLSNAELAIDVEAELAPPPFENFLLQLFGDVAATADQQLQAASATVNDADAAGLEAAVDALCKHTALLEQQGVLLAADGKGLQQPYTLMLPAYLQTTDRPLERLGQQQGEAEPQYWQQHEEQQHGAYLQQQAEAFGIAKSDDVIQDADDGDEDWGAFEDDTGAGDAALEQHRHQLFHHLLVPLPREKPAAAAGAVHVAFDDEELEQHGQVHQRQQALPVGCQATLSDLWEYGDGGCETEDPWAALEGDASAPPSGQQQAKAPQRGAAAGAPPTAGAWRVPTFAPRRKQLPLSQSTHDETAADCVPCGDDEDEWDAGMLEQVAALEQAALQQQHQAQTPSQQQRRVPQFRNRAFTQQQLPPGVWPAGANSGAAAFEGIEETDSDEDFVAMARTAAPSRPQPRAAAVPQVGRRAPLALASGCSVAPAAAADASEVPEHESGGTLPALHGTMQCRQPKVQPAVAEPDATQVLCIDFANINVDALKPSVLLRQEAGRKPKWKPVLDPESLLLPPLRAVLQQTPPHAAASVPLPPTAHMGAATSMAAAAELMAGITAEDLADWDDWGDDLGAASGAAPGTTAVQYDGSSKQGSETEQQQQWQHTAQECREEDVAVEWDEPALSPLAATATDRPELAAAGPEPPGQKPSGAAGWRAAAAISPIPAAARFNEDVQVCFDDSETDGGCLAEDWQAADTVPAGWHPAWQAGTSHSSSQAWQADVPAPPQGAGQGVTDPAPPAAGGKWEALWHEAEKGHLPASVAALPAAEGSTADVWAAFDEPAGASSNLEDCDVPAAAAEVSVTFMDDAWEQEAAGRVPNFAATKSGSKRSAAAGSAGAGAEDPWAALEADCGSLDSLPAGQSSRVELGGSMDAEYMCQGASSPAGSPVISAAMGPTMSAAECPTDDELATTTGDAPGLGGGCWGCDIEWEDGEVEEQQQDATDSIEWQLAQRQLPGSTNGRAGYEAAHGDKPTAEAELQPATEAVLAADVAIMPPEIDLEWEYDDVQDAAAEHATEIFLLEAAGEGFRPDGFLQADRAPLTLAGKRRHEEIGAQIIKALLEERQRACVDLQPLLQQLRRHLGAALAGTQGDGSGGTALLSAVRSVCMEGGVPGTQASPQRYLMAVLTAVNQHNSGAAAGNEEDTAGGGNDPNTAAVAGRHLYLCAPPGATDVSIVATELVF